MPSLHRLRNPRIRRAAARTPSPRRLKRAITDTAHSDRRLVAGFTALMSPVAASHTPNRLLCVQADSRQFLHQKRQELHEPAIDLLMLRDDGFGAQSACRKQEIEKEIDIK